MKILFCGSNAPLQLDTKIKYLSAAANRYQHNFIKALKAQGNEVEVFSYIGFPLEEGAGESIRRGEVEYSVRYVFKEGGIPGSILSCSRVLKEQLAHSDMAVAYNSLYAWFILPHLCRRMGKKSVLILADYSGPESYSGIVRKLYAWLMKKNIQKYDVVVGLSEQTKRYLKKKQGFICSEGGLDKSFYDMFSVMPQKSYGKLIFMYAGILEPVTGIDLLLQAFRKTKNADWELWISGKGSLDDMVREAAGEEERIRFLGFLEYEEYINCLKEADVLVNPRNMSLAENRNNFPSKIMEYLATGKEIISTRFMGAKKFEEYVTFCESDADAIASAMQQAAEAVEDRRELRYTLNREFAREYLWQEQMKRIMKFIGG